MTINQALIAIVILCAIVLIVGSVRNKLEYLVTVMIRVLMGTIGIEIINYFMLTTGVGVIIGVNGISILASGLLGLPGIIMLYVAKYMIS